MCWVTSVCKTVHTFRVRGRFFYSYFRMSTEHRSLLVVYVFNFYQTLRVVPHGTKGTGPGFITRPVYLRSQFRNNTNTVSTLVLLIHLLQVLCTRYASNAHHRVLQTSGRGWADSKAVHRMECSGGAHALPEIPLSRGCCLKCTVLPVQGGCTHLHDRRLTSQRTINKEPTNKEPKTPGPVSGWYI